jgi:chaperonin cofactor prefoldin
MAKKKLISQATRARIVTFWKESKAADLLLNIAALEKKQRDAAQQLQQLKEALAKTKHGDDLAIG